MESTLDVLDLRVGLSGPCQVYSDEPSSYLITQAVWINGENLARDNPIDLRQLSKSCQLSGEFYIATCECGDAGCAEIEDGIRVVHLEDRIVWEVPDPLSYRGMPEEEWQRHQNNRIYRKFAFNPEAYLAAVRAGLRDARKLLLAERQPVECSPYGFEPEDILALDPEVFSMRGAPIGSLIIGKHVAIEREPGWVCINNICYRLKELPVPEEIKKLDDWSNWEPKRCGDGYTYGYVAAPGREVRRRMKLLGEHLAGITIRGSDVVITLEENWVKHRKYQLVLSGRA